MRFFGGLLKFLGILVMLLGTVICTAVAVMAGVVEGYTEAIYFMILAWVCVMLVALNIWGTGAAMTQVVKLKKRVEQLEQRLVAAPVAPMVPAAPAGETAPADPYIPAVLPVEAASEGETNPYIPAPAVPVQKKAKNWIPVVAIVGLVLVAAVAVIAVAMGGGEETPDVLDEPEETFFQEAMPTEAEGADCAITINGICVDDSFVDDDGSPLKMVYLFYTISAEDTNLNIDSKYTKMYIGSNEYESDHFADAAAACKYAPNYYYSSYIEDVYVGSSLNVVATFYIPEGDLGGGKTVTFQDSQIPGIGSVSLSTDEFLHFGSPDEIAMAMDPEGYEQSMYAREEADATTTRQVQNMLNGYYWSFYVNYTSYKLEFWATNNFSVTTSLGTTSSGTYSVRNGYIFCTYPDTGYTVEIPYEIVNGELELDTIAGFDVLG